MALQVEESTIREKLEALQAAAHVFGFRLEKPPKDAETAVPQVQEAPADQPALPNLDARPTIREIVLSRLRFVGTKGAKAASIRQYLEREHGIKTHEKTVGMTLYRLLKARMAYREGTTWFFDPTSSEKKNPAGDAAGLDEEFFTSRKEE